MTFSRSKAAASNRDQTGLVPSSALSCQRAYEGVGFPVVAVVGHWRLPPEARRSRCLQSYMADRWSVEGLCPRWCWWPCLWTLHCLRVTICFFGAISAVKEAFWGKFFVLVRESWVVGTQLSTKAPVCGGDFLSRAIEWSILTINEIRKWGVCERDKIMHSTERGDRIFTW